MKFSDLKHTEKVLTKMLNFLLIIIAIIFIAGALAGFNAKEFIDD